MMLRDEVKCEQIEAAMVKNFKELACPLRQEKFADIWLAQLERKVTLSDIDPQDLMDEL